MKLDIRKYSELGLVCLTGDYNARTGEQSDIIPNVHIERYVDIPENDVNSINISSRENVDKTVNSFGKKITYSV